MGVLPFQSLAAPPNSVRPELVEGPHFLSALQEERCFDKLSTNGVGNRRAADISISARLLPVLRHLRNPLPEQRRAFPMHRRAPDLGHRDAGVGAFETIDQETMIGISGRNRELHPAAAASRRRGPLADSVIQ